MKTDWDLSCLYKSINDPQIERDIIVANKVCTSFEKKYKSNKLYLKSENALLNALNEYESILGMALSKPILYFHYILHIDSSNDIARSKLNLLSQKLDKISNKTIFFTINLSKIQKS